MTRSAEILLLEIRDAIRLVNRYLDGLDFETFATDTEKQDAVVRRLEIIGEAVKNLPRVVRDQYRIDLVLAWQMITDDLPKLADDVERILGEME